LKLAAAWLHDKLIDTPYMQSAVCVLTWFVAAFVGWAAAVWNNNTPVALIALKTASVPIAAKAAAVVVIVMNKIPQCI
jgi:hypothetical protein